MHGLLPEGSTQLHPGAAVVFLKNWHQRGWSRRGGKRSSHATALAQEHQALYGIVLSVLQSSCCTASSQPRGPLHQITLVGRGSRSPILTGHDRCTG